MPTYVYECKRCKKEFEVEQRITEPPLTQHNQAPGSRCKGPISRVLQPIGVSFKGSGFHVNDYPK